MKIFISSTYEDLKEHRRAVRDAILQLGHHPIAMEYFGARSTDPQTAALGEIEQCGALVGIYAHRFGWVPEGDTRSITEQEFDFARAHKIPCYCYRVKRDFPWDNALKETGAKAEGLARFLAKVDSTLLRVEFTTPEDLAAKVAADLGRELSKQAPPRTPEERDRRIILGHVENFWVKGVLEKSLHGVALLELGIKEDLGALNYPWAIKRESTQETLPAGTSMLDVFQEIGLGRTLLILGAPGAGKTTMLLELTRQLIGRARQDPSEPIPIVFNLSSWTETKTLAEWLLTELNAIYNVPKKIAQTWVKENKLFLLLDGLDESRQASRDKCVDAINQFRKEHGLTCMVVCSRSQEYAELNIRLAFDGAIEIQPLTINQVNEYFNRVGKQLAGIRQVLEKDTVLREMAESPLFLSIMTLAYRDTPSTDILVSESVDVQRKHLFDTYIARMFGRPERSKSEQFKKQDVLRWLSWLARKMIEHNQVPFLLERMQPDWLSEEKEEVWYRLIIRIIIGLPFALGVGLLWGLFSLPLLPERGLLFGLSSGMGGWVSIGLYGGLCSGVSIWLLFGRIGETILARGEIGAVDSLTWNWRAAGKGLTRGVLISWLLFGLSLGLLVGLRSGELFHGLLWGVLGGLSGGLGGGMIFGQLGGLRTQQINQSTHPRQRFSSSIRDFLLAFLLFGVIFGPMGGLAGLLGAGLFGGMFAVFYWIPVFELLGRLSGKPIFALLGGLGEQQINQPTHPWRRLTFSIRNSLFAFLLFGQIFGQIFTQILGLLIALLTEHIEILVIGLIAGPIFGLLGGLGGGLIFGLLNGLRVQQVDQMPRPGQGSFSIRNFLFAFLLFGLLFEQISTLPYALISRMNPGLSAGLPWALFSGLIFGLLFGQYSWLLSVQNVIRTVDSLTWNWKAARKALTKGLLICGLISSLFFVYLFREAYTGRMGLPWDPIWSPIEGLLTVLGGGLIFGLLGGLIFGLFGGLREHQIDQTTHPGQGLYFSIRNFFFTSLLSGLIFGLSVGLIFGLLFFGLSYVSGSELFFLLIFGLSVGPGAGLIFGLLAGLYFGGFTVIQHCILRVILSRNKLLPRKLVTFLAYATNLIFLRRVGGGYIFVHRMLMEHFAALETE